MASTLPNSIGPFVVLRTLGEGSMGVVYAGYDVDLDRKVALKLVHRALVGKPQARARMLREAQALARLSSPHVVQVYQVGEHRDGSIYLAMEYVEGKTLRAWLKEPRPWLRVLRTICDAGRGLVAAHAAGLVHRDFKPENVLIDGDDRPRVLDFGLVLSEGETESEDEGPLSVAAIEHASYLSTVAAGGATPVSEIPAAGGLRRVVGTPAYMSPEQHLSEVTGPTSDVYSFSVTLYEGLYGVRPFTGASWQEIREKVLNGVVPPPPSDSRVPRRIFRVLARGLAVSPEERWPSIDAMLVALEHDPWRRRLQALGVVGALGAASAVSYSAAVRQQTEAMSCERAGDVVASVWGAPQREALEVAFRATGAPFAEDVRGRVAARLDAYTAELITSQRRLCTENLAGTATARLLDLRSACLGRRRTRLTRLVDILAGADRDTVENAVQAVAALPSLSGCDDDERLLSAEPLPEDEATATRVGALREELERIQVTESLGHYEAGLALAREVHQEAEGIGYTPLTAEAALREGSLLLAAGRAASAVSNLDKALRLAIVDDLPEVAAEAAVLQIFAVSEGLGEHHDALLIARYAESFAARSPGDGSKNLALFHNNVGLANDLAGDDVVAAQEYQTAIEILLREGGDDAAMLGTTYHNLGGMYLDQGDFDRAAKAFENARQGFEVALGSRHPLVAHPVVGLGDVARERGDREAARSFYAAALETMTQDYGPDHIYLIDALVGLGAVIVDSDPSAAERYFRRVVDLCEAHSVAYAALGAALEGLGDLGLARGKPSEALASFERAAEVYAESSGATGWRYAKASLRAGRAALLLEDPARARSWFERVLAVPPAPRSDPERADAALLLARGLEGEVDAAASLRLCPLLRAAEASLTAGKREEVASERARVCAEPS